VKGVKNVLHELGMFDATPEKPEYQIEVQRTKWVRADRGGFLQFHVQPGEVVENAQPLATNTNLLGHDSETIVSPFNGVILGMTTLPAVSPGEPICHVGKLPPGTRPRELRRLRRRDDGFKSQILDELASNVLITEHADHSNTEAGDGSDKLGP